MRSARGRAATIATAGTVGTNLVLAAQAVVLVPVYLARIGQRLYGGWLGSGDALTWLQMFDLGLGSLLTQRMGAAQGRGDEREVGRWLGTGFVTMGATTLLAVLIGWAIAPPLATGVGLQGAEAATLVGAFRLGVLAGALVLLQIPFTAYCRGTNRQTLAMAALFLGSLVGFGLTVVLLLRGAGLYAIPAGLMARNVVQVLLNLLQAVLEHRQGVFPPLRFDREVLGEQLRKMPVLGLSSVALLLATQGEILLVALTLGPVAGTVAALTRRAIDVARSMVDSVAATTYGAFAHLVASPDADRAPAVGRELVALRNTLAVACVAGYLAVNPVLVPLWAGRESYGGFPLTVLMGLQFLVAGWSLLVNSMLRASGAILEGSWLLLGEVAIRLPLVWLALRSVGLPGLPAVTAVVSLGFGLWTAGRLRASLRAAQSPPQFSAWIVRALVLAGSAVLGRWPFGHGWLYVIGVGLAVASLALLIQLPFEPDAGRLRRLIARRG